MKSVMGLTSPLSEHGGAAGRLLHEAPVVVPHLHHANDIPSRGEKALEGKEAFEGRGCLRCMITTTFNIYAHTDIMLSQFRYAEQIKYSHLGHVGGEGLVEEHGQHDHRGAVLVGRQHHPGDTEAKERVRPWP